MITPSRYAVLITRAWIKVLSGDSLCSGMPKCKKSGSAMQQIWGCQPWITLGDEFILDARMYRGAASQIAVSDANHFE